MEGKSKRSRKKKKASCFKHCFVCVKKKDETDDISPRNKHFQSNYLSMTRQQGISVPDQMASSHCNQQCAELNSDSMSFKNIQISQAYMEKLENNLKTQNNEIPKLSFDPSKSSSLNREQKDALVRLILSKYLTMKKQEILTRKRMEKTQPQSSNKKNEHQVQQTEKSDFINIECPSDSCETIILDNEKSNNSSSLMVPKIEFPTKSKSAPTNSTTHDSLADICFKMKSYKQEPSDSYITCCSEEIKENSTPRKKLELIFNLSSEESSSENSVGSLQYKISCERTMVSESSLRRDQILQQSTDEGDYDQMKQTKLTSQELYIHPFAKGEFDGINGSTSSLKWKLIISHHGGHGDFR